MLNKKLVIKDFSRSSKNYNKNSILQKKVAEILLLEAKPYLNDTKKILDIGSGTGYLAQKLKANLVQLDISYKMCEVAKKHSPVICGDVENLPFKSNAFASSLSSLCLQWVNLDRAFAEIKRVLQPNSYFIFSIFLDGSLQELKDIFHANGIHNKINSFYSLEQILEKLTYANFKPIEAKNINIIDEYKNIFQLLKSINTIGGGNKNTSRKNAIGKQKLDELSIAYKKKHGKVFANWQVGIFVVRA